MADRIAIPAELRRRVLVEAGHRCAIHTCQHPEVDLHHIIPWGQCKEHSYDNLIALCPNCHRRADAGEIDRKALRMYKAQLVAKLGIPEVANIQFSNILGGKEAGSEQAWRTHKVADCHDEFPLYEVELEYPVFMPEQGELEELNTVLHGSALRELHKFRDLLLTAKREDIGEYAAKMTNELVASFEISLFNGDLISIRFSYFSYGAGAAHPQHFTDVVNYQREPLIPLTLETIFEQFLDAIGLISQYSIAQITLENGDDVSSDWVSGGASPESENFSKFNLTERGLLITFDEYQVGPYAEGSRQVIIPWHRLYGFLNPMCKVAKWLGYE